MKKQAVLSLSGGMDSSTVLLHLLAKGYQVTALSFDYGQKHNVELERAAELIEYLDIWTLIDNIWHLKPLKIEYMNIWKTNQEKEMFLQKGNALKDENLSNFLRMLNVSIPHKSFDVIKSYALLLIDQERNLVEAGLNL